MMSEGAGWMGVSGFGLVFLLLLVTHRYLLCGNEASCFFR